MRGSKHVHGLHEPIISETLFYEVQQPLDGKKKDYRTQVGGKDISFVATYYVPGCEKLLTGSRSGGGNSLYYYYVFVSSGGARFRADTAMRNHISSSGLCLQRARKKSVDGSRGAEWPA